MCSNYCSAYPVSHSHSSSLASQSSILYSLQVKIKSLSVFLLIDFSVKNSQTQRFEQYVQKQA